MHLIETAYNAHISMSIIHMYIMFKSGGHSAQQISTDISYSFLADLTTASAVAYILC